MKVFIQVEDEPMGVYEAERLAGAEDETRFYSTVLRTAWPELVAKEEAEKAGPRVLIEQIPSLPQAATDVDGTKILKDDIQK